MLNTPADKYQPFPSLSLPDRRWPEQRITHAQAAVLGPAVKLRV